MKKISIELLFIFLFLIGGFINIVTIVMIIGATYKIIVPLCLLWLFVVLAIRAPKE